MGNEAWQASARANTDQLEAVVAELESGLKRNDYREFWNKVRVASDLFKGLKPTYREERDRLWRKFGDLCNHAKQQQDCERTQRANISSQKRELILSKIEEAYHQAKGARGGADLRDADQILQQALGWMKDGYSGFGIGTQFFAANDGRMLKEHRNDCWNRWTEVKETIRARRAEICDFNYGHFKGEACDARGLARTYPKDAKAKVRAVQSELKGATMDKWQFEEVREILNEAYNAASVAQEERHREWERKQQEWRSRMEEARSKKQGLIEKNRDFIQRLERQISDCDDMIRNARSSEHQSRVQGWIDEKTDKIRDIERFNRELEDQISEIDTKLNS
jgi:hypothetical protein